MNIKKHIFASMAVSTLLLVGLFTSGCDSHDSCVGANEVSLFRVHVQVVDAETNQPVDAVMYKEPKLLIEEKMKNQVSVGVPLVVESPGRGVLYAIWLDLKESKETFTVFAGGYPVTEVPLRYREQFNGAEFSSGEKPGPAQLKLNKKSNNPEIETP